MAASPEQNTGTEVAIIGMAGRWPGANTPRELWRNVCAGTDSISRLGAEDLEVAGASALAGRPDYVRARSVIEGVDRFDAAFFGILPREAELMDPQHRVFLECCWEALEDAGYDPETYPGSIGVIAGCAYNSYFLRQLCSDRAFVEEFSSNYPLGNYPAMLGAIVDTLATRVSYKLNLRGPSFTLQSACSTSLVAVCQAAQSLLTYQCDMALAGGVAITFPQKRGYHYQEGAMGSADGRCRPFEASARGTVFGSGAGVILLKRLDDAIADGDHMYAVIKGYAVNNDGSSKAGMTAPSVDGQSRVISLAQALAGVEPESIGYLEAHGTATPLGDPIEFEALTRAFRARTQARQFCGLGTVKRYVGHLEMAAGVTGLISTAQALEEHRIPPAAGFEKPAPGIELTDSPFYVNRFATEWPEGLFPRRAGVSAFGVGGTNAHVVLEESPVLSRQESSETELLVLSARSPGALESVTQNLISHLRDNPGANLADVAYTLQVGRRAFAHRRVVVCSGVDEAISALRGSDRRRVLTGKCREIAPSVVFMFPGQGSQHARMAAGLYHDDPGFRDDVDTCARILEPLINLDLRTLFSASEQADPENVLETRVAQPALFTIEYALAKLWLRWGVRPVAMIGHSLGEFVAACLAGVFTLEDALTIVATRARMMQTLPPGLMLAVRLGADEVARLLPEGLSLAASNGPMLSVISGPSEAVVAFQRALDERGIAAHPLATSHAFHSAMMDPIVGPFVDFLRQFRLNEPEIPFVSTTHGTWITPEQATDPAYWGRQIREPVRFSDGIGLLSSGAERFFLEVGPGEVLGSLARTLFPPGTQGPGIASSLGTAGSEISDRRSILRAAGALWLHGVPLDWNEMYGLGRRRCSLPTYPFERERYWVESQAVHENSSKPREATTMTSHLTESSARPAMSASPSSNGAAGPSDASRVSRLQGTLIEILESLSGLSMRDVRPSVSFLEIGFDSLLLTQVTQEIQSRLKVPVKFRQLLGAQSSIESLAAYLDPLLAPTVAPVSPQQVVAPVESKPIQDFAGTMVPLTAATAGSISNGRTAVEDVVRQQLEAMSQLMTRQLDLVREITGGGVVPPSPHTDGPLASPAATNRPAGSNGAAHSSPDFKAHGPYKPVDRGPASSLNERQTKHLRELVARYTTRTARSKSMTQSHRQILADPRVAAGFRSLWKEMVYPIVTNRSSGSRLVDIDGNEYIDILNGFGAILLGHAPELVTEAVTAQLQNGFEIGPQTPLAGEVARLICELTGVERVSFCNTGSEAVMAAIRLARTVTGRMTVVLFAGAYHGTFDEVLVKGIRRNAMPHSLPIAPGIPGAKVSNVVVLDYGTPESLDYIRAHANELAAVLVEPVQSRHPASRPVEFLREVRRITADSGAALIFDEIVTGFRVHQGGAQALFDIRADLATYGKVVGGGMPIGVVAGSARFMDALDGGFWQYGDDSFPETGVTFFAGTFVRHPLALASARAVLGHLKQAGPQLQNGLNERTARLARILNSMFERKGVPTRIEHFASWFYFSFPPDQPHGSLLYYHLRARGIHIQEGFPCFLTTAHSESDLLEVVAAFEDSVNELQAGGFLLGANHVERPPATNCRAELPVATSQAVREFAPTESQTEIWLSARLGDDASCSYNETFRLELRGSLDPRALANALETLISRHDALRCTFDPDKNCVVLLDPFALSLPVVDLTHLTNEERVDRLRDLMRAEAETPFDLVAGPLIRVQLIRLEPGMHWLLFTSHHIVCDGWSTNVLLAEMGQLYGSAVGVEGKPLSPALSFREYARRDSAASGAPEFQQVEAWWVSKFATTPVPLDLPTDRPRGVVKSFRGDTLTRKINADTCHSVKRFGAQNGCTLLATLLTGFKILLHRLTGQSDIVVGIPAAGQSLVEAESLVGHCVNFLPVRTNIDPGSTGTALLVQMRETLLDAYEHQTYTYGSLVRKLGLRRDPSRLPLVEVQFNLEKVGTGIAFPGLEVSVEACPKSFVNFDLFLNVVESDAGLTLDLDYNRELFDPDTVDRWLQSYEKILTGLVSAPARELTHLPILSDAERHHLIVERNATEADFPSDRCVHHLIGDQARRTPESVALVCDGKELTYAELEERSNRLAHLIRQRGVSNGDRVAICLNRSVEMVACLLGTLKAGATYVPLDPEFPPERINSILQDCRPSLVLTQRDVAPILGEMATYDGNGSKVKTAQVVCVDQPLLPEPEQSELEPSDSGSPTDIAYLIYTSGSTGKPKGVEVSHRAVVNFLCSMADRPGMTADDTLLAVTTVSFDIAVLELFLPLTVGAKVVIAAREDAYDGNRLLRLMRSSQATVLQATPATWGLLLEAGWGGKSDLRAFCGGEAMSRDLADALIARCSSVWNMYGPTETTVWSAVSQVGPGKESITIGPPIANTEFYVLDAQGQPVPLGVTGELYIGGLGLARGYWNRTELTTKKFVEDGFRPGADRRLYRTGDLVRARTDGNLDFLGRLDNQVKIRGFRIETGEVEHALQRHPAVSSCVVVAREDVPGQKRLVGYIVPAASSPPTPSELRQHLSSLLPAYMVPSLFVRLETLPQTPNGKIDRRALPVPEDVGILRGSKRTKARTPEEKTLARISEQVLRQETIYMDDNLFDLGADSLRLFQIVARAKEAGLNLSPKQILLGQTIGAICGQLDRDSQSCDIAGPELVPVRREGFRFRRPV